MGIETGDDAAVYRLSEDIALVQTVDFFPPIVDDPYTFGAIATANALSDIYAMGGKPLTGLSIVSYPKDLNKDFLVDILKGSHDKAKEAGLLIVGGHTINDQEPKYGMSVTGILHPGNQVTNASARRGDSLILTKPIGTGIITTAAKQGRVDSQILEAAITQMKALNNEASTAMLEIGVHACTDVTGFGLLGHLRTMLLSSKAGAEIHMSKIRVLPGVLDLTRKGIAPDGTLNNLKSLMPHVHWDPSLSEEDKKVLSDAQTSGGLLISVSPDKTTRLMNALVLHGVTEATIIGTVIDAHPGTIYALC